MRTNKRVFAGAALVVAALGATSWAMASGGATVGARVTQAGGLVLAPGNPAFPGQSITADCTATCELWARPATITVPGVPSPINVWGFSTSASGALTLPGPTIIVNSLQAVSITVHNDLPAVAGSLAFDAPNVALTDRTSAFGTIATGAMATVTFTAKQVGTSTYGAGAITPNGNRQVAMGLAGVLIVRPGECPTTAGVQGCAYGDPVGAGNAGTVSGYNVGTDTFQDEALVAMNDLDPLFAADPLNYDMTKFHPTAHLINGRVFPETEVIDSQQGHNVLVRYANLGLSDHSMGFVGSHQRIIGRDASALPHGSDDVTIPLNVRQTVDAMIAVPLDAKAGYRYALADQVRQPGAQSANGAMTFLTVWGDAAAPGKPTGDVTAINPSDETNGDVPLDFAGAVITGGPANGARYSIDDPGANLNSTPGSPGVVTLTDPLFTGTIPVIELSTLANGSHILWVELSNDAGTTWGDPAGISFTIDRAGPVVRPVTIDPVYTNATTDLAISATADSSLTGTGTVVSGTASLNACPALGTQPAGAPLTTVAPGPIVELTGSVPAATIGGLADGTHTVNVAALDNRGRWSSDGATIGATSVCGVGTFVLDRGKPATSLQSVDPPSTDGTVGYNTIQNFLDVVRVFATANDPASGVAALEGFLDDGGPALPGSAVVGSGFRFTPVDGLFDSPTEAAYADIPLAAIASLTPGPHGIWIHSQDKAGNWEDLPGLASTTITVTNGAPLLTTMTYDGTNIAATGVSNGVGTKIVAFEYSVGASTPPAGAGTLVPVAPANQASHVTSIFAPGSLAPSGNVWVRTKDSTGKWSAAVGLPTSSVPTFSANRRQVFGTATATAGGVAQIEYSIGASAAAAGSGTPIPVPSTDYVVGYTGTRVLLAFPPQPPFAHGAKVWVRVRDGQGNWGPAVVGTVP